MCGKSAAPYLVSHLQDDRAGIICRAISDSAVTMGTFLIGCCAGPKQAAGRTRGGVAESAGYFGTDGIGHCSKRTKETFPVLSHLFLVK